MRKECRDVVYNELPELIETSPQANTVLLFLQGGEVGVMKRLKRYKTSSTKPTLAQPNTRPQAVQQPAIMDAVLETTARLTQAATVM